MRIDDAKTHRMMESCPDRFSVMLKIVESSSLSISHPLPNHPNPPLNPKTHLHATRLTAVKNSQVYNSFPVAISHNRIVLSAAPVTRYFV
jgi:hypothetical protein